MIYDTVMTAKSIFPNKNFEYFYPKIKFSSYYIHNKLLKDTQKYALKSLVSDNYETYKIINNYDYYVNSNYKEIFDYATQFYKFKQLNLNIPIDLYHVYSKIDLKYYFDNGQNLLIQYPDFASTYEEPKYLTLYFISYILNTAYIDNINDIESLAANITQIITNNSEYISHKIDKYNFLLEYINQYQKFAAEYFTTPNIYKLFIQKIIDFIKYYLIYYNYFYNNDIELYSENFNSFITNSYKFIMTIYKEDISYTQMNKYKFNEIIMQIKYLYTYLTNLIDLNNITYELNMDDLNFPENYTEKIQTNFILNKEHIKMIFKRTLTDILVNNLNGLFISSGVINDYRQLFICTMFCIDNLVDDLLEDINELEITTKIDTQITRTLFAYYMDIQKNNILEDIKNYIIYRLLYLN